MVEAQVACTEVHWVSIITRAIEAISNYWSIQAERMGGMEPQLVGSASRWGELNTTGALSVPKFTPKSVS